MITRHWSILRLIPRKPRCISIRDVYAALLAQGYEINLRTVQRDLQNLSIAFPLTCEEGSGRIGTVWYWPESAPSIDIPGMVPAEALAFMMSRAHLSFVMPAATMDLLEPHFQLAEKVLAAQPGNRMASWKKNVRVLTRGPRLKVPQIEPAMQHSIYEAVLLGRQLNVIYRARSGAESREMQLHPLGLVVKDSIVYLVATAWEFKDVRHYALHRFESAELAPDAASRPRHFSLDRYIDAEEAFAYPLSPTMFKLELSVGAGVAQHLGERQLSEDQQIHAGPDGGLWVKATVADTSELRWWLLGFGSSVEVVAPETLRREMAEKTRAAAARYVDASKGT